MKTLFLLQSNGNSNQATGLESLTEITLYKITIAVVVVAATYGILWANEKLIAWVSEKVPSRFRLGVKQSLPFCRAVIILIAVLTLVRLFVRLSANNLLALTGTTAVALGFAFKDYASSLIAGFIALFEGPYRVGDRVAIGEHYGEIVSYGLRGVRLKTPDDNLVTIPHNKIWTDPISNANAGELEAQAVTHFYLAHEVDVELVMKILYQAAYTSKYTQLKLPIVVILSEKPWGSHFQVKSYPMDARDEFIYQTDLIERAKQTFAKYGVEYPSVWSDWSDRP
ncbi:mechanosensitive ion channel family protein [Oxynema aestuarii]|jgi:small-conductance mechanosensitive channel|uniref:Mechanosensitive ion channel family protein n=1 Tax=Oxynema aestuarii AP17 TaxID=2064643 RepID=A0A6H1TVT0_9CYAN|nr:mechanosensitive ion channel family protein [Oxynema aestuarii]QIZ70671.1 mechanosensitive ion channel family protein [Oxynema aestuarii AP17]